MQACRKSIFILALLLGAGGGNLRSQTAAFGAPNVPVSARLIQIQNSQGGVVQHVLLTQGTNRFIMPVPEGYRLASGDSTDKIVLVSNDNLRSITLRTLPNPGGNLVADTDAFRRKLLSQHPGARITEEFVAAAAGSTGLRFDLQWSLAGGATAAGRVAYIPNPAGIWEFSAFSPAAQFSQAKNDYDRLLASFARQNGSKVEIKSAPETS